MHGSSWNEVIYTVLGEDSKTYTCTYGRELNALARNFIRTPEDHLARIEFTIGLNNEKIRELNKEIDNIKLYNDILTSEMLKISSSQSSDISHKRSLKNKLLWR